MSKSTEAVAIPATALPKVAARTASEICGRLELSAEALSGLLPTLSPQGFLAVMMGRGHVYDAVRFLAYALPVREGIWWACVVAGLGPLSEAEARCLDRAEAWVYDPSESARRACLPAAEALAFKGAAAYSALAVFWSGGSLAPEGGQDVPPHPDLGHIGISASLLIAAAAGDPVKAKETFQDIVGRGVDIACGGNGRSKGDRPRLRAAGSPV